MHLEISECIRENINLYEKTAWLISKAIQDCRKNGNCKFCDENTPCSSNIEQGVDYHYFDYNIL